MKMLSAIAAVALAVSAAASHAVTTYNFSYVAAGAGTLSGQLTGTLQADNNTVLVSSIVDFASWNTVAGPSLPFVNTVSGMASSTVAPGLVTLDGSVMDIIACDSAGCGDGFLFDTLGTLFGVPVYSSGHSFGARGELYSASSWSLSAATVPEPASWALMITGFGLVGSALRRRRVAATA